MKILLISSEPASDKGFGSGKFVAGLAAGLTKADVETFILTGSPARGSEALPKIRSKILRKFVFDYVNPLAYQDFARVSNQIRPDVVHFNNVYGLSSGLIRYASKSYPTVVTVHDYWPFCYFSTMMKRDEICNMKCEECAPPLTTISRRVRQSHLDRSVLVSPSLFLKEQLMRAGFVHVTHIPNGIDMPKAKSPDNPRLIFIGRLDSSKGVDRLARIGSNLTCPIDIVGTGPLAPEISKVCQTSSHMTFHGYLPNVDMMLSEGGVLVIPSIWPENQPFVALEGLAYGLPIVSSNVGGLPELVEHGVNGYLFEPRDQAALVNYMLDLISNEETRREFGSLSRAKARNFSWERTSREYVRLYESVTAE